MASARIRTFQQWLDDWRSRDSSDRAAFMQMNENVLHPGLKIYVRASLRCPGRLVERAATSARVLSKGAYTRFLDQYDETVPFYVENVLNPRLAEYLVRRGSTLWTPKWGGPPCGLNALAVSDPVVREAYT